MPNNNEQIISQSNNEKICLNENFENGTDLNEFITGELLLKRLNLRINELFEKKKAE